MTREHSIYPLLTPHSQLLVGLVLTALALVAVESVGIGIVFIVLGTGDHLKQGNAVLTALLAPFTDLTPIARIQTAALVLIGFTLVRGGLQYSQQWLAWRLRTKVDNALKTQIFRRLHEMPLALIQGEHSGVHMTMLGQYTQLISTFLIELAQASANAVILVAYVGLALALSWPLTLLCLLLVTPVNLVLRPLLRARLRTASQRQKELMKELASIAQEHAAAMKVIHLFGREDWSQLRFAEKLQTFRVHEYRASAFGWLNSFLFSSLNAITLAVIMLAGAFLLHGPPETLLTQLVLFLLIAFRLQAPVSDLTQLQAQWAQTSPMWQELVAFLGAPPQPDQRGGHARSDGDRGNAGDGALHHGTPERGNEFHGGITFENVTFAYKLGETPVLQDVALHIPQGAVVALVGASGAGKSTLVNLLTRLYEPTAGRICVDGVDLRDLDVTQWRSRLGVVNQDIFLFHASVWENLRFAKPEASDAEIYQACQLAQAHGFIMELPEGYATILQARGTRLSGGQRQRIALARALLINADVLILDEATSELDAKTEAAFYTALEAYRRGRTVAIITHRPALLHHADRVYRVEDSRVWLDTPDKALVYALKIQN